MKNLRISHKLWWAVLAIVLALAAVVGTSAARSAATQARSAQVTADMASRVEAALRWAGLTETNAARTQAIIVSTDPAVEAEFKDLIAATTAQITEVQKSLEALPLSDADKAQMGAIATARKTMADLRARARQMKAEGKQAEAAALVKQSYNPAVAAYLQTLRDFVQLQQRNAVEGQQAVAAERLLTVRLGALAVALLVAAIVAGAYFLIRSIQQPLAEANALAARIAGGDLSAAKTSARGDEFGELLRSLQTMGDSLGRMVQQVRRSTDSIAIASAEIAAGNQDLSTRTEQTSSNLQQTAATMEQFSSTLQQSAGSAREASGLAEGASGVARRGGEVVSQVVATMEEIQQSSRKIEDIIGVIDSIAFQTNILALNAAVEAARAGEQGRGFAVVAGEVRLLAGRSAEAAREIKALIGASVERVDAGSRLVQDAGATMADIVQSVQRVADMIGEVTAAASQQSSGIAQVNQAVGHLDQMTQQNAALVEESAAAAQSLREQADHLAKTVSVFRVDGEPGAVPAAPAAAPVSGAAVRGPAATVARARMPARAPSAPSSTITAAKTGRAASALGAAARSAAAAAPSQPSTGRAGVTGAGAGAPRSAAPAPARAPALAKPAAVAARSKESGGDDDWTSF
ncbi:methyl-accepting chemotaxis protein [Paracidovorax valerianellae]|uniref:Methyl-accepting chemotaxis protein n=1 Tax=Paracidovorax valerianellae TaxID=187868 RepID=A0A1G6WSX4_9BURK|nr:methyl-accepting chemotaxis protein [Paracidovorax valerianellae]MDA8447640.1 methyl-accepting chemotaxis protein [Paracidovorax valerianellae]SDD68988.1 Methyl-accepting chemotaxis protein [Paracidovorax valerianellae]